MKKYGARHWILLGVMFAATVLITALIRWDLDFTRIVAGSEVDAGVYATLGDICVYASVMLLGGPWGALVSALGALLADVFVGSYHYIVGSFLIKGGMAFFVAAFYKHCDQWKKCIAVAGITELIMVLGYFIYEFLIAGSYTLAAQALPVNLLQGVVCAAIGTLLLRYLPQHTAWVAQKDMVPPSDSRRVK